MQTARRRRTRIKQSNSSSRRPALSAAFRDSTVIETAFLVGIVVIVAVILWIYQSFISSFDSSSDQRRGGIGAGDRLSEKSLDQVIVEPPQPAQKTGLLRNLANNNNLPQTSTTAAGGYKRFFNIAQELAALEPTDTLDRLEREDPFGTRQFDQQLLQQETELGRVLTIQEIQQLFPCPIKNEERITLPDARVEQKARDFRDGKKGTFLFFQHLRKVCGVVLCLSLYSLNYDRMLTILNILGGRYRFLQFGRGESPEKCPATLLLHA